MIHSASPQTRPAVIFAWYWSFGTDVRTEGRTYGLTDNLCENNDYYRPGLLSASWIKGSFNPLFVNSMKILFEIEWNEKFFFFSFHVSIVEMWIKIGAEIKLKNWNDGSLDHHLELSKFRMP